MSPPTQAQDQPILSVELIRGTKKNKTIMSNYSHNSTPLMAMIFFIITTSFLVLTAHQQQPADLGIEICKNTTDFSFCKQTLYSDPHFPTTDLGLVTSIIFNLAFGNATDTTEYIKTKLSEDNNPHYRRVVHVGDTDDGDHKIIEAALIKCLSSYNDASLVLASMLRDFDSDTFYKFDVRSKEVEGYARDCEKRFRGVRRSSEESDAMSTRNVNMLKLANICYAVSKLYRYGV